MSGLAEQRAAIERARVARTAASDLDELLKELDGLPDLKLIVASPNGERAIVLPASAAESLVEILDALGRGRQPSVVPMSKELGTGEVAGLLGVSRQYAVRLLDDGRIPFRRVGNRRRVLLSDALRYLRDDDRRRVDRLRDMAETTLS